MTKVIHLEIDACEDCPYLRYDGDYGRSYDSGYDCEPTGKRIVDDYNLKQFREAEEKWLESLDTLLPLPEPTESNPLATIPDWCPLKDKEKQNGND